MLYFNEFNNINYNFGNETDKVVFQNISLYGDVIDQVKDNVTFANGHTIQEGFRPDQVSLRLYDTPLHYWTFYLLNDNLREQGWPLNNHELTNYIRKSFPNTTITTRDSDLANKFKIGQTITGNTSGKSGKIIRRNINLGQIFIEGDITFRTSGENYTSINSEGAEENLVSVSSEKEYLSESHYINGDGEIVDIDPAVGPGALLTGQTFEEIYFNVNSNLRQIKVIKPELINSIVSSFKKSIRG